MKAASITTVDSPDLAARKRILITGGAGFIGSHLAERLLVGGAAITVVDDLSTGRRSNIAHLEDRPDFRFIEGSVSEPGLLDGLAGEADLIFHLAAVVGVKRVMEHPVSSLEGNFLGTQTVLKAAQRYGVKVLVTSTSEVYGKNESVPFGEEHDTVLGPTSGNRWSYAASKMVSEYLSLAYHREFGLPVVIVRLFNTVGPRQTGRYGMVVPRFVQQARQGRPLTVFGDGTQTRCFLHVHDAVAAIQSIAACDRACGRVLNIGSTKEISILDLARRTLALVDPSPVVNPAELPEDDARDVEGLETSADGRIVFIPEDRVYSGGFEDMPRRVPDIARVRDLIGWQPQHTLDQILRDVAEDQSRSRRRREVRHGRRPATPCLS